MTNFKNKILNTLRNENKTDETFKYLSNIQNNLIKNYSNPVFSNKDKNKLLEKYSKVENLGKTIYRLNVLKQNDLNFTKEEKNVSSLVLKGGISNCKYVWHSENSENTCEECAALDGTEYNFEDEVPARPHPNCQCRVEIIENDNENTDTEKNEKKIPSNIQQKWMMPCNGSITSTYGMRKHPVYNTQKFHNGWDIAVPVGTPIRAITDGKIIATGPADGYGKWIVIDHGKINGTTVTSEYGHISASDVTVGQQVKVGQIIAKSGNTGTSTGPHLHITIREGEYRGKPVDPNKYIPY